VDNLRKSTDYNIVFRYELDDNAGWQDIQISVVRPGDPSPDGPCANIAPSDDFLIARYRHKKAGLFVPTHPPPSLTLIQGMWWVYWSENGLKFDFSP
jgi:hypothetical protein